MLGTLYLLPNLLGKEASIDESFPSAIQEVMLKIDGLIAENPMRGRTFIQRFKLKKKPNALPIAVWNEDLDFLIQPLLEGESWGLVSDCGLPCLADPGANVVSKAHKHGIPIEAVVGPSSIYLSLMLSGLGGQKFFFHGYLAKDKQKREGEIENLAVLSKGHHATQIFIEAPYRNEALFESLLSTLPSHASLCVAWDLMLPGQGVYTRTIKQWKAQGVPEIHKKAAIFLFSVC
jgi:16S rRNA (cytidine1402-2'-O)-methyltransferase